MKQLICHRKLFCFGLIRMNIKNNKSSKKDKENAHINK